MLLHLVHGARTADEAVRVMAEFADVNRSAVDLVSAGVVMGDSGLLVCLTPGTTWLMCAAAEERGTSPPFEQCSLGRLLAHMPLRHSQHEHRNWVFKSSPPVQEGKADELFGLVRHVVWQASALGLCPSTTRVCLLPEGQGEDSVSLVLSPGSPAPVTDSFLHLVTLINAMLAENPVTRRILACDGPVKTDTKQTITLRMALDHCNDPAALRDFSWRPASTRPKGRGSKRAGPRGGGRVRGRPAKENGVPRRRSSRSGSKDGPPRKRPKAPAVLRRRTRSGSVRLESTLLCGSDSED